MTEEELQAARERMAELRLKAIEKKKEMGQVTKSAKEVKEALFQKKREEVEQMKRMLHPPTEPDTVENVESEHVPIPKPTHTQLLVNEPSKQFDEEALRKQIKAEMKRKYKSKYAQPAFPYFPYYPYPQYQPMAQPPQPQAPPQPKTLPKQAMKEVIRDKVNDEVYKMVYSQLFPNL
jgi:hypothetical protein